MGILTRLWDFGRSTVRDEGQPYCRKCTALLRSAQGLIDLCSETGYTHHSRSDCLKSAQNGCALCELIFQRGWTPYSSEPLAGTSRTPNNALQLHFFAIKMAENDTTYRPSVGRHEPRDIRGAEMLIGRVLQKGWYTIVEFVLLASSGMSVVFNNAGIID